MKRDVALDSQDLSSGLDEATLRALYPSLHRFAAVVAPWDMDPDDVLHDALVQSLRVDGRGAILDPGAYLRTAILNAVRSQIRRNRSRRIAMRLLPRAGSPAERVSYPSDVAELMRLRADARAVLFLHDIEKYTFEEVSEMLGLSSSHVRVLASRARKQLKRELLKEERR